MVSVERVRAIVGEDFDAMLDTQHMETVFRQGRGPAALTAISESEQTRFCSWGMDHSDGFINIMIAILKDETRDTFLTELRSSEFSESEQHGATVFTWMPRASVGPGVSWYAFDGNLWVGAQTNSTEGGVAAQVLIAVRSANPDYF